MGALLRVLASATALAILGLTARVAAQQASPQLRLVTPEGHTSSVMSAAFSPDGRLVVTASLDRTARVWEVASGRELQVFRGHTTWVNTAAFSPDGRFVVTASDDATARVWEVASGRELQEFRGDSNTVNSATFSHDGRSVVTASDDATVRVWDLSSGHALQVFRGDARLVALSPDGRQVMTSGIDGIQVWEVASGRKLNVFHGLTVVIYSAAFSPDGRQVVIASTDGTARVWDVASGQELQVFRGHTLRVNSAAYSADGRSLVTAGVDGTARVWEVASGRELQELRGHVRAVYSAAFSQDGRLVVTAGIDGKARIWEVASGRELQVFQGYARDVIHTAFSPDGRTMVTTSGDRRTSGGVFVVQVWEVSSGRELCVLRGHSGRVQTAFSPDGRQLVTTSDDQTARVWEASSGRELQVFRHNTGKVYFAAFSPDGRQVVTTGDDKTARVWEVASGREILVLGGHAATVRKVLFSSDGRTIVTLSDSTIRVWEVASGRELKVFQIDGRPGFWVVSLSPDGSQVLTTSLDHTLVVWEVAGGREIQALRGFTSWYWRSAEFSPDGRQVVTTAHDETARVWEVASGRELQVFRLPRQVSSAVFSPDGRQVITVSEDHTTRVWDVQTGSELFRRFEMDSSNWVAIAPDGRFDGTEDGVRRLYYARGIETMGLEAFFEKFYTPGLTGLVLSGTPYHGPDIRTGFGMPPSVRILNPQFGDTVSRTVTVVLEVKDQGGGAEDVRVYDNGSLIAGIARGVSPVHSGCPAAAICFRVELLPGTNILEATAFSSARIEAERARVTVSVPGTQPTATLYVVAVGINRYQNPSYDLNYGRADASAFVDSLLAGSQRIFAQVVIDTLYDRAATALGIKGAFRRVAAAAQPQDVFVFFYAGHGVAEAVGDSTRFYLVPTDVTQMSDPQQLAQHGVANLQELFDAVPARKKLMLIDACQSGEVLQVFARRGVAEEQAIARLARASGIFVMSAAGSDQFAAEVATLGHGVFTYAWLRAMARDSAGPRERLVGAIASEVERTIPDLSRRYRTQPQYPRVFRNGQDFPLLVR